MRFTIFQESRKGSRKVNQDRIAYTYSRDTLLLVVADGMGGHAGGEIAAQIAVRLFIERFQQEAKPILKNPLKFLQDSMLRAHAALGSYANQFSMLETPRTTCVACIVQAGHAYWAHVGDSRLYLYRQGGLIGADEGSFEGPVSRRSGHHRRGRRRGAPGSQQDLQLPGRPRRSGDRSRQADAASQRRRSRHVHRRHVERDDEGGDIDLAHVDADPQVRAADDARGGKARRARRRQPLDDRRALGSRNAHRRAVDDDHRDARPRRIPDADRPHADA